MDSTATFVIVGGGLAGAKAAQSLREEGFEGRLLLCSAEPAGVHPYERPPLSKGFLLDAQERDKLDVHDQAWYTQAHVEIHLGNPVTDLDPSAHEVLLAQGERLRYDRLLLATGASPRLLDVPGADLAGVQTLRTVAHAEQLRERLRDSGHIVIVGAGWIGLEVAAAARAGGVSVTVLEQHTLPLLTALGPEAAQVFAELHRSHDVDLRPNTQVAAFEGAARGVTGVRLTDGTLIATETVLVAVGATPNTELAEKAGLEVSDGIVTDEHLRTSDPDIFAAGDVARAWHPLYRKALRIEHWANALNQPKTAARAMLGQDAVYDRTPYFYTDQYDLGMEYTGYVEPDDYDQVVFRGNVPGREFIAFWLKDGRVLAGMNVNTWNVTDPIRDLVRTARRVDPARLADPSVPLDEI